MSAPVIDLKLRFRPGFQAEMDKGFQKVQYAFSQQEIGRASCRERV